MSADESKAVLERDEAFSRALHAEGAESSARSQLLELSAAFEEAESKLARSEHEIAVLMDAVSQGSVAGEEMQALLQEKQSVIDSLRARVADMEHVLPHEEAQRESLEREVGALYPYLSHSYPYLVIM